MKDNNDTFLKMAHILDRRHNKSGNNYRQELKTENYMGCKD